MKVRNPAFEHRWNFDTPECALQDDDWLVWYDRPNDDHTWAFVHFCRRQGDMVYVKGNYRRVSYAIKRCLPF